MALKEHWIVAEIRASRAHEWTVERRALYLLVPAVGIPLSVDPKVWPIADDGTETYFSIVLARPGDEQPFGDFDHMNVPADLTLLGYDVADGGKLSGLANCGYESPERDIARAEYSAKLNEHHLFRALDEALVFRTYTEERVPEHAPFFVYGVYAKGP